MKQQKLKLIIKPYRKVPRYFVFTLAAFCWLAALTQLILKEKQSAAGGLFTEATVPAYSSRCPILKSGNYRLCSVSKQTYELFSDKSIQTDRISDHLKSLLHDSSIQCIYSHQTSDFHDLYYYSPILASVGISPIGQGYNLHAAITDDGHIYLGFPNITNDY